MSSDEEIDSLVSDMVEKLETGAMLTKYIVIAEGIDPQGERAVYMATHTDAKTWDILGLLSYAQGIENAGLVNKYHGE